MKKLKNFSKKYLIGFTISLFIVGIAGAYAAVTFPSNAVSYDNSNSKLKSNNVKSAIDELYNECKNNASENPQITNPSDLKDNLVTIGDGLYKDEYENRYFYKGVNPDNYVNFNNELWRILSIEEDGSMKIIKQDNIGKMAWDSSNSNNWARPATLNTYLNETYYNSLNSTAKDQIASHEFSIGKIDDNNDLKAQINDENAVKWNGEIALPTASEYLRTNSNINQCKTHSLNNNNTFRCNLSNWLLKDNGSNYRSFWTLSSDKVVSSYIFIVTDDGSLMTHSYGNASRTDKTVHPTLYLKSNIKITGGLGTEENPYQLSL